MTKKLNEELNKMRNMMGLINESLTDVEDDVNFIYDKFFKEDVENINKTGYVTDDMFKEYEMDSSMLKSDLSIKCHELRPVKITINKKYPPSYPNNFFKFDEDLISISISHDAVNLTLTFDGDIYETAKFLHKNNPKFFMQEFSEEKIKGSIHHELVHWIDDTLNKKSVERSVHKYYDSLAKFNKKVSGETDKPNINFGYMERQAQIHNIKQIYNKHKDKWDELTFKELLMYSPPLYNTYNKLPDKIKPEWVKLIKRRMHREGLLGKKMTNK